MRRRLSLLAVLGVVVLGGWAKPAFSQVGGSAAQLNGSVRDESGGSVAKATITVRETETNRTYTAVSGDNGLYLLASLPPGRYELTIEASGFSKSTQTGIVLSVGQVATIDVVVKVAASAEKVVVTTETPPVEPTRTEVSQVISTDQIQSLPISGRLFTDFALLTPGVATGRTSLQSTITETEVTRISFGGMRDLSNMVTVDGADTVNTATGSQRGTPSQEAVSEFRVVNNGFGAEQGRALGGIVNIITKSGTNDLHGSVYDYLQNGATNARSLLKPSTVASPQPNTLRQNQYGATLGGPIKKDKTFFFLNFEGQRRGEAPTYPTILINNLALINSAKALLGIDPENLGILKTADSDRGLFKIDHQLNKDNRLSVRYNIEDARNLNVLVGETLDGGGIGAPSSGHNNFLRDQSLAGILSSQLKPDLINTALVQYARRHSTFPGVTGQPNLDLPNSLLMGHNFGVFDATYESRAQISDSVFWVKGAHLAKFGVDYNYLNDHIIWPGFSPMRIVLPGVNCLVDFANHVEQVKTGFAPGNPNYLSSNFAEGPCPMALPPNGNFGANTPPGPFPGLPGPNFADVANGIAVILWPSPIGSVDNSVANGTIPPAVDTNWKIAYPADQTKNYFSDINHSYYGFFAQDQWRLTPKLTLNYGIRWDFEKGLEKQINDNYKGFQPRVGLAYSPDRHTVIRAGFGIFDDRYNLSFLFVTFPQRPIALAGVNLPDLRKGGFNATYALSQLPFVPGILNPTVPATNLVINGTYPAVSLITDLSKGLVSSVGDGTVEAKSKIPYSEQSSLEIDREVGKGLVLNVGYLFVSSHHQVRAENLNVCPVGGSAPTDPYFCPQAPPQLPGYAAGKDNFGGPRWLAGLIYSTDNSGNSIYHGLTLSASERAGNYLQFHANYTFSKTLDDGTFTTFVSTPQNLYKRSLERGNSNQDIRHRFVANFTANAPDKSFARYFALSGIVTLESPRPFTMFVGFDANGDTNPVTDRVGNLARNTYWGDNLRTVDLRLSRYFKFRERQKIELAVDAFNAFNRANVNEVTSVYGTYNFCGAAPVHYKDAASLAIQSASGGPSCYAPGVGGSPVGLRAGPPVPNPGFGGPRTMFNPRQFQFSLKYSF
jgi:Carboxypeptidase regulatory-like domain/TonB dependent receptor